MPLTPHAHRIYRRAVYCSALLVASLWLLTVWQLVTYYPYLSRAYSTNLVPLLDLSNPLLYARDGHEMAQAEAAFYLLHVPIRLDFTTWLYFRGILLLTLLASLLVLWESAARAARRGGRGDAPVRLGVPSVVALISYLVVLPRLNVPLWPYAHGDPKIGALLATNGLTFWHYLAIVLGLMILTPALHALLSRLESALAARLSPRLALAARGASRLVGILAVLEAIPVLLNSHLDQGLLLGPLLLLISLILALIFVPPLGADPPRVKDHPQPLDPPDATRCHTMSAARVFAKSPELHLEARDVCIATTSNGRTLLGVASGSDHAFGRTYPRATRAFLSMVGEAIEGGQSLSEAFCSSARRTAARYLRPDPSDPLDSRALCATLALVHGSRVEIAVLGPAQLVISAHGVAVEVAPADVLGKMHPIPMEDPKSWIATKALTLKSAADDELGLAELKVGQLNLPDAATLHIYDRWPDAAVGRPIPFASAEEAEAWRQRFRRPYVVRVSVESTGG